MAMTARMEILTWAAMLVWPGGTCTICLGGGDGEDHAGGGRAGYRRRPSSRALTFAPFGINVRTTSPFNDNDARCKGVEWLHPDQCLHDTTRQRRWR
ncbi:hypothetical protein EDB85DRAFT_2010575 [Lactarius pseudohatsudake]|nr:hypothetical protein EDB85DRAFT_2010575 [Lactarius pseudohatsudake]